MIEQYKNYFFDLGGTLIDTANIDKSFTQTDIKELNYYQKKEIGIQFNKQITHFYISSVEEQANWIKVFEKIFDELNIRIKNTENTGRIFLVAFTKHCILKKYTINILEELKRKDKNIFLVSNVTGPVEVFNDQIKDLKISNYFNEVFWSSEVGFRKPSIKFMEYVLKKTKVNINESVLIGDSEIADVGAANVVGMDSVLVSEKNMETKAKYIMSYNELYRAICW